MGEKPNFSTHPRNFPFCFLWGSCAKNPPTLPSSPVAKNHLHNHSPQRTWMAACVKFEKDVAKHLCVLVCGHIWIRLYTSTCTWAFKPTILLTNEFLTKKKHLLTGSIKRSQAMAPRSLTSLSRIRTVLLAKSHAIPASNRRPKHEM